MTSTEVDGAGTSSARRRRERRLRSWWRHERMTVAMELAAATHHSSPKGGWPDTTHDAPWGQKTASSAGAHPGVLKEPEVLGGEEGRRGGAVTVGYVAAPMPTLALPVLAGSAGEAVDDLSLRFLLGRSLAEQEEEEEKRRKAAVEETIARLSAEFFRQHSQASSSTQRRRKKRKKKKLPRGGRAHRRSRQRYVLAGFAGYDSPRAVFPSIVNARGDSTGAVLGQGDMPVVILSGGFWSDSSENCGFSAVAVLRWPSTSPSCRKRRSPWSSLLSRSWRFYSCCFFWWSMSLLCWVVQVLRCCRGEDLGAPTVAAR